MKKILIVGSGDAESRMLSRALRQNPPAMITFLNAYSDIRIQQSQEAVCIGCGCTDGRACTHTVTGPCWWIKVDRELRIGVCSECEEKVEVFEQRCNEARGL